MTITKRKIKKITSVFLALGFMFSTASACKSNDSSNSNDPTNTDTSINLDYAKDNNGSDIFLVENGRSNYKIVKSVNADVYENYAAKELQAFFSQATGVTIQIIDDNGLTYDNTQNYISVGTNALFTRELSTEKYGIGGGYIDVDNRLVCLSGANGYGILNATYEFMHQQIGYEAYALTEIYVENMASVQLLDFNEYDYLPATGYRVFEFGNLMQSSAVFEAARMGLTIADFGGGTTIDGSLHSQYLTALPKIIQINSQEATDSVLAVRAEEIQAVRDAYISEVGGEENIVEEDLQKRIDDKIAEYKSAWFGNGQICLTNPEVLDYVIKFVKERMLASPTSQYLMLSGFDAPTSCTCSSCSESMGTFGTQGGLLINFANQVAASIEDWRKETIPECKTIITVLAYLAYEPAPAIYDNNGEPISTLVKARDDVGVFLCFPGACNGHGLTDPNCSINKPEYKKLKAWSLVSKNIGVYLYWSNYNNYFTYYDNWGAIQTWAKTLSDYGVTHIYADCPSNRYSPFSELKCYLMSKYFVDPNYGDFEALVKDFMKHYYKSAADEMYAYYQAIRAHTNTIQQISGSSCVDCYDGGAVYYTEKKYWPINVINNLSQYLYDAYEAVNKSTYSDDVKDLLRERILCEEATMRYYKYSYHKDSFSSDEILTEKEWLLAAFDRLGITHLSEGSQVKNMK